MAYFNDVLTGRSTSRGLFQILSDELSRRSRDRRAFRKAYDELAALSDRDLADIGLHRSEIAAVARKTVRN